MQTFLELHDAIQSAYGFDNKFEATFFRSNDKWQRGKEITKEKYANHEYVAPPLFMNETKIGTEIINPDQKFIYVFDFTKKWTFLIALISVTKTESGKITYPYLTRSEGIGPQQYGTKSLLGDKFVDIEEKYDLSGEEDGYGSDGEDSDQNEDGEEFGTEEELF